MIHTLRRWWKMPDHYYPLTAVLAGRGAQRDTCSTISTMIIALGMLPVLMIFSPAGPAFGWPSGVVALAAAGTVAVGLAWRRTDWPSRTQSRAFAVVIGVAISAISMLMDNPVSGIVTCSTFAALAAYVSFLHTARYAVWVLLLGAGTVAVPFARLTAAGDPVWAWCLAMTSAVITVSIAVVSQALVQLLGVTMRNTNVDPVTGLLNRTAIRQAATDLIGARSRQDDRFLVLVLVSLDDFARLSSEHGSTEGNQARVAIAQTLRENTRHDTLLGHIDQAQFLIVDIFTSTDASPLTERVRSAIRSTPPHLSASIGVVSTPLEGLASCPPDELLDELLELATDAMLEAQRIGGNAVHAGICQRPATLDRINRRPEEDGETR